MRGGEEGRPRRRPPTPQGAPDEPTKQMAPYRRPSRLLVAEAVDDGEAPVPAKRARRDLHADRALAALVLGAVDHAEDPADGVRSKAPGDDVLGAHALLDVGFEDRVELRIWRQRVLVLLIGAQLGRRRALEHGLRDDALARAGVDVARELIDEGLRHVLDHGEAAGHVAVERRVADGDLALVAGGENEPAELVRERHQQGAADARSEEHTSELQSLAYLVC